MFDCFNNLGEENMDKLVSGIVWYNVKLLTVDALQCIFISLAANFVIKFVLLKYLKYVFCELFKDNVCKLLFDGYMMDLVLVCNKPNECPSS